jgi:hypothetical protein
MYAIIKIRVSQRDRWTTLGFELPVPGNGTRKKVLLTVQNRAQVHRKPTSDLVPFSPRRVLPRFVNPRIGSKLLRFVRNRMPVSLRGGGGELGNLKP